MLAIGVGGALGASVRWAVVAAVGTGSFPWPVLAVNLAGSFVLGAALAAGRDDPRAGLLLHDGVGVGFCGGLTTFSTFAVEVVELLRDGAAATALAYAAASVAGAAAAVVAGAELLRRGRGLRPRGQVRS